MFKKIKPVILIGLVLLAVIIITIMFFYNRPETFEDDITMPSITNNSSDPSDPTAVSAASLTTINLDNVIEDATVKETVSSLLTELRDNLANFNNLEVPISVHDKGKVCAQWGSYDNSKYILQDNSCIMLDPNKRVRSCLDDGGLVQTCNSLYGDGLIDTKNAIQIGPFLEEAKSRMIIGVKDIEKDLEIKNKELELKVNDIVGKKNIEGQQVFFIQYNLNNLDDKRKNVSRVIKDTDEKENSANINQLKFSKFLEDNKKNEATNNFYIKIMKWLGGIIFVLIIIYLLLSSAD